MVVGFHLIPTTSGKTQAKASSRRRKSSIVWSVRKRQELMRELAEERREAEREVFEKWFAENEVNKESLRKLIRAMGSSVVSDEMIDSILSCWSGGQRTPDELRQVAAKTIQHHKEQNFLDKIFDRYDFDKSGFLEPSEVRHLLQAVAQGDVMHFDETDPAAHEAACTSYKLRCIDELKRKGIINEKVWREKRANVVKRHQSIMSPRVGERAPDDDDLDFVLENCDKNNDQKISRDELLAAIDLWIQVSRDAAARSAQQNRQNNQSHFCVVM